MVLKDWKKSQTKYWNYWNSKKLKQLTIDKNTSGNWNIILGDEHGSRILLTSLKTKSQAIKYAKAYMKKH